MKRTAFLVCAVVMAFAPAAAMAQWSDNFDSYPLGPANAGGWDGWGGSGGAQGLITNQISHSAPNSIEIAGGADATRQFSPTIAGGQWTLTAWSFVPTGMTSDTFFIVMNDYDPNGPPWGAWSIQMEFDLTTGTVLDEFNVARGGHTPVPIAFDRWAEIRLEIDLDADTVDSFYDGAPLSSGPWVVSGGVLEIANIDLFTLGTTAWYDDLSIVPEPSSCLLVLIGVGAMLRRRR